jgi:hypothetical protein
MLAEALSRRIEKPFQASKKTSLQTQFDRFLDKITKIEDKSRL